MHDSMHNSIHSSMHSGMHDSMHSSMHDSMHSSIYTSRHTVAEESNNRGLKWPRAEAIERRGWQALGRLSGNRR